MNLQNRARRAIVLSAIASAVAVAVGAASVAGADSRVQRELVDAEAPPGSSAGESPPDASVAAPTTTTSPTTTQPPPAIATTTTAPIVTTTVPPAAIATTTAPPAAIATTTAPPAAIATTTTTPPAPIVTVMAVTAPTAPQSPIATAGNASVKLTWLAPSSNGGATVDKYAVQRSTSAAGPWTNIAFPTTRGYTASSLVNGTKYYFRIVAHNSAGWSPVSTVVSAVPHAVAPSAPPDVTTTVGNGTVTVMWLKPVNNGGAVVGTYRVQQATSANGPWTTIATPTTLNHTATSLTNGTRYYFRIAAHNDVGWGPYSIVASNVPFTVPGAPQQPQAEAGAGSVHLWWAAPSSTGGSASVNYVVQQATSWVGPWTVITGTTARFHTATGLTNGTTYYFRIYAFNAAGWSASSYMVAAVPVTIPDAPSACSAHQAGGIGSQTMQIKWSPPVNDGGTPVTYYHVVIRASGSDTLVYDKIVSGSSSGLTVMNFGFGYYYVQVFPINDEGTGMACTTPQVVLYQ